MRRFYRLVTQKDPPLRDFLSLIELGHAPYDDPEVQRRAEAVSVWDSLGRAARLKAKKPDLPYVAILDIPESVQLSPGRHGHWGIPRGTGAEQIKRWVVEVVPVGSSGRVR